MKNTTSKAADVSSKRFGIGPIGIKTCIRIILTGALLLTATSATAGLLSSPMGVVYTNPAFAPVASQTVGDATLQIRSDGLIGELTLDASELPPELDPPASGCKRFAFDQRLELVINLSLGLVEGHTRASIATENGPLEYRAELRGNATCVPVGGQSCGQLIVDLETRGALADATDPARVGLIHVQTLGSLVRGPGGAYWASLDANARLAGDEETISSLTSMGEGESCGI